MTQDDKVRQIDLEHLAKIGYSRYCEAKGIHSSDRSDWYSLSEHEKKVWIEITRGIRDAII